MFDKEGKPPRVKSILEQVEREIRRREREDAMVDVDIASFGIDETVATAFAESLCEHIVYVQEAGRKIGVADAQLVIHDDSKWTAAEFPAYAVNFKSGGSPVDAAKVSDEFAVAWLHHIHYNPHHWQHWIFPDGYSPRGSSVENGIVKMPNRFALEMIADWMGASKAYTDSWDMKDWLYKNMPKIRVHSETAVYLRESLDAFGYADVVWAQEFAHEK